MSSRKRTLKRALRWCKFFSKKKNVFWLEISVYVVELVYIVDAVKYSLDYFSCGSLFNWPSLFLRELDEPGELPAPDVLHF